MSLRESWRRRICVWLRAVLAWLEQDDPVDPVLLAARAAVRQLTTVRRGPARHTQLVQGLMATAVLKRQFPEARTRDLNYARERAVQELPA